MKIIERITVITGASNMKVIVISIFCALAGHAAAGAIGWPGAVRLATTIIPGETSINAYSTSQYLNAVPASYSFGAQPQFAIHGPYANSFASFPNGLYSIGNPSYIQPANIFYPSHASLVPGFGAASIVSDSGFPTFPNAPSSPSGSAPTNPAFPLAPSNNQPAQIAGDADSAIIDSAEFANQQRDQDSESSSSKPGDLSQPQPSQPEPVFPQPPPSNTFPQFPTIPQIPQENQGALVPQYPQNPSDYPQNQNSPQPQIPQSPNIPQAPEQPSNNFPGFPQIPQNPQDFASNFPQFPQIPQGPPQPPSSFPAPGNNNASLNDEDTISVESA